MAQSLSEKQLSIDRFIRTGLFKQPMVGKVHKDVLGVYWSGALMFKVTPTDIRTTVQQESIIPMLKLVSDRENLPLSVTTLKLSSMPPESEGVLCWAWKNQPMVDDSALIKVARVRDVAERPVVSPRFSYAGIDLGPQVSARQAYTDNAFRAIYEEQPYGLGTVTSTEG